MIFRALLWIAEEIQDLAEKELYDEPGIHRELADAYRLLETHAIDEAEFSAREARLMERLEAVEARRHADLHRHADVRRRSRARRQAASRPGAA